MTLPDEIRSVKMRFLEVVDTPGHKLIAAAQALRVLYRTQSIDERQKLVDWVRSNSNLDRFISGEDTMYYIRIAVLKQKLRDAHLEHLQRYSSDAIGQIEATFTDQQDEYTFNIWRTQWSYVEAFMRQFEIPFRVVTLDY